MKLSTLAHPLILLSSLLPSTHAWGGLGHETVAYVASSFLNSKAQIFFQTMLSDTSVDYLANVATWADSFRYTNAGKFSEPFHFIDSKDNPPLSCGVTYKRDCGSKGCVVGAIQNYVCILVLGIAMAFEEGMLT
jgi:S1/P1 Nuclease